DTRSQLWSLQPNAPGIIISLAISCDGSTILAGLDTHDGRAMQNPVRPHCWLINCLNPETEMSGETRLLKITRRLFRDWHSPNCIADRKSTRLNSSHLGISYAVFCLKKKKHKIICDVT